MTIDIFAHPSFIIPPSSILALSFQTFGNQHLITLGIILAACVAIFRSGRRAPVSVRRWIGLVLGFVLLSYAACLYIQQGLFHSLDWEYSLPLELCSLVLIACILSLFRPSQFLTEIAYFWGMGGVLQATVTPDLAQGFPSWDFILFFWGHGATLIAIVFLISGRDFRLHKYSIARMMVALNAYGLLVGTINAIAGWNYGYLCRKPAMPSLLDFLGPWPWYLLSLELIAFLTFLVLDLFWRLLVCFRKPVTTES